MKTDMKRKAAEAVRDQVLGIEEVIEIKGKVTADHLDALLDDINGDGEMPKDGSRVSAFGFEAHDHLVLVGVTEASSGFENRKPVQKTFARALPLKDVTDEVRKDLEDNGIVYIDPASIPAAGVAKAKAAKLEVASEPAQGAIAGSEDGGATPGNDGRLPDGSVPGDGTTDKPEQQDGAPKDAPRDGKAAKPARKPAAKKVAKAVENATETK